MPALDHIWVKRPSVGCSTGGCSNSGHREPAIMLASPRIWCEPSTPSVGGPN